MGHYVLNWKPMTVSFLGFGRRCHAHEPHGLGLGVLGPISG